jgi:hypothetical protein
MYLAYFSKVMICKHILQLYRTLMKREVKGCFIHFTIKKVEAYFKEKLIK